MHTLIRASNHKGGVGGERERQRLRQTDMLCYLLLLKTGVYGDLSATQTETR